MSDVWAFMMWFWGDTMTSHAIALFFVLMAVSGLRYGWLAAGNTERLNRKLQAEKEGRQSLK